jgi:hypothetical protein
MHPYEWGILGVKAIALLLAIGRTIPSQSLTSAGCFACKQDSGRAIASGIRRQCRTAPTGLRRTRRRSIVKAAALYTLGLAPGFNIDSRSRQAQFYQSPNSQEPNFRATAVESERELTSTPNNSYGTLAKTIKTINCSFLPPYNVYLTWLAMGLAH